MLSVSDESLSVIDGIDLSSIQGDIDAKRVAESGVRFAYVKCTQYSGTADWRFWQYVQALQAQGVPCGPYHFCSVASDPTKQAAFFFSHSDGLGTQRGDLPPLIDYEFVTPGVSAETASQWLDTFVDEVERLWYPGNELDKARGLTVRLSPIYVFPYFAQTQQPFLGKTRATRCPLHMASYPGGIPDKLAKPPTTAGWDRPLLWQYSGNNGVKVPGIGPACDRDRFMGTEEEFSAFRGYINMPADNCSGDAASSS